MKYTNRAAISATIGIITMIIGYNIIGLWGIILGTATGLITSEILIGWKIRDAGYHRIYGDTNENYPKIRKVKAPNGKRVI